MGLPAITFGATLAAAWALTFGALWLGRRYRILDYPDQERKLHARAVPRTGGLAVSATLAITSVVLGTLAPPDAGAQSPRLSSSMLILSATLLCGLGLWDDKWGMTARRKFLWQVAAILPFALWGRSTAAVNLFGWPLEAEFLTVPLLLLWLVSCANFVNLMDGLDGLAGTVGLVISLAAAAMAALAGQSETLLLACAVSGALAGFLLHNWPPARIFLGDCGSLPLGFLVGALSLDAAVKKAAGLTLAVPLVLLCIPMFDTSMAILRRKLNGRQIGQGDRAHIHHCLRDRGLSPTQTLLAIGGLCALTAAAAIVSNLYETDVAAIAVCAALLSLLVAGRVFGFDETILLVRHARAVGSFLRAAPRALRARFIVVRLGGSVSPGRLDLWHKIVGRARRLPGVEVEFRCEDRASARALATLAYAADEPAAPVGPTWSVAYVVPRGAGLVASATARGPLSATDDALPYHELAQMLAALCRNWPVEESAGSLIESTAALRTPQGPRILSPQWPSEGAPPAGRSAPPRRASDAA